MSKVTRVTALLAVLALFVAMLGVVSAQDGIKVLRTELGESDVPTLDPSLATDASSIQIINQAYVGLTVLDEETLELAPGLAESWEITANEDGTTTFTFTLRNDVSWVRYNAESGAVEQILNEDGSPRMVVASDVVYGITRTLNPLTASEYAYVLSPSIVGGVEFNTQEVVDGNLTIGPETLGISAPDDTTFIVTAPQSVAYTASIYGLWMARPQLEAVIVEFGDFWIEDENYVGYGSFVLKEWLHDESLTIIKNPFWPGNEVVPQAKLDEVIFFFLPASTALAEYEAGNLDALDAVNGADIPRIKVDPVLSAEYYEGVGSCSYYYGFSTGIEPFNNAHIRRAFSYAVDRQDIVDNITRSGQTPAPYFSIPSLVAAPLVTDYPELGIGYNPEMALEELALGLAELGYSSVDELPTITILFNTNEGHRLIAEAIAQMWFDTLGVTVQTTNQEFAVYLDQRSTFPVWRAGWCFDYPDANNFLYDVFHSSSNNNDTGWTSAAYDAIVEEAAVLEDTAARTELYAQAENILVLEEAAILPIYWYSDVEMSKPYVERTYTRTGDERFENWDINR